MAVNNTIPDLPLRDIHLPAAISWWPPALGWWLSALAISLLIILTIILIRKWLKPTLKKQASKTLTLIETTFQQNGDASHCLQELSIFLRRVTLSKQQLPAKTAGLTGQDWLKVLDQQLDTPEFSQGVGQILLSGPYQRHVETQDIAQLLQICRKWIQRL